MHDSVLYPESQKAVVEDIFNRALAEQLNALKKKAVAKRKVSDEKRRKILVKGLVV